MSYANLGDIYLNKKKYIESINNYEKYIEIEKNNPHVYNRLGHIYYLLQSFVVNKLNPDNFSTLTNLLLKDIILSPEEKNKGLIDLIDTEYNLGEAYYNAQEYEKAIEYYKGCLNILYDNFDINDDQELNIKDKDKKIKNKIALSYANLGDIYYNKQDIESAINLFKHSLIFYPDHYLLFLKLGICFDQLDNNSDAAIFYLNKSLKLNDNFDETYRVLGNIYYNKKKYIEAINNYEKYIEIEKNNPYLYNSLGHIFVTHICLLEKGFEYFKTANKIAPGIYLSKRNLLLTAIGMPNYNQVDLNNFNRTVVNNHLKAINFKIDNNIKFSNTLDKNRKIHIGFLSNHIWNNTTEIRQTKPIFKHYNKNKFKISCYTDITNPHPSAMITKSYIDNFKDISKLKEKEVADLIRNDKVDILVLIDGYFGWEKIFYVPLYKSAPIQINYASAGWPISTGIPTIDYIFAPQNAVLAHEESSFTEKVYHLDFGYEIFDPVDEYPDITPLPALENGYITFGYFNRPSKTHVKLLEVWSEILKAVPNSKFLVHRTEFDEVVQNNWYDQFEKFGINTDRLIFLNNKSDFLNIKGNVDISLDSFPYNGYTITIDSFMMGAPVICMYGDCMQGRVSARMTNAVGYPELVAKNEEEYVKIAVDLANNIEKLKEMRSSLRNRILNSKHCDYKSITKSLEKAFIQIWHDYCDILSQ